MAANRVQANGDHLSLVTTAPSSPVSGDPVVVGQLPGVALASKRADNTTSIQTTGVFNVSVKGIDGGGNSAVAVGDILYYTSGDTPPLSKKATGVRWGYAAATVGSGSTATIAAKVGY